MIIRPKIKVYSLRTKINQRTILYTIRIKIRPQAILYSLRVKIRRVAKLPWGSFLSANNALKKNVLFNSHPDFIFCGLFLCPWSLGRPTKRLRGRFRTHRFDWKLLKEYFYFVQKLTLFQEVSPELFGKK